MSKPPFARPTSTDDLVTEIHESLIKVRARRASKAKSRHEWDRREREVALDVTLALLIRHRMRIDLNRVTYAVKAAQCDDPETFAHRCAEHILRVISEHDRPSDQEHL